MLLLGLAGFAGAETVVAMAWIERYAPRFAELEAGALDSEGPTTLLHGDVRSDNLLFRQDGSVVMVDWPLVRRGPGVVDATAYANAVTTEAGPPPEETMSWYAAAHRTGIGRDDMIAASRAGLPELPGLPRVRTFQRAQLVTSLRWLTRLLRMPEPEWLSSM